MIRTLRSLPGARLTSEQQLLATAHLALVAPILVPWQKRWPAQHDELESVAYLALVRAALQFDPARGVRFDTYATYRINGSIRDVHRLWTRQYVRTMGAGCGRSEPWDRPVGEELDMRDWALCWLQRLPWRHAQVCRALYLDGQTQLEVARALGYSTARVSRIHTEAIAILRRDAASRLQGRHLQFPDPATGRER